MPEASTTIITLLRQMVEAGGDTLHLWDSPNAQVPNCSFRTHGRFTNVENLSLEDAKRVIPDVLALPRFSAAEETAFPAAMLSSPGMPVEDRWTVAGSAVGLGTGRKVRFTIMPVKGGRLLHASVLMVFPASLRPVHWMADLPGAGTA